MAGEQCRYIVEHLAPNIQSPRYQGETLEEGIAISIAPISVDRLGPSLTSLRDTKVRSNQVFDRVRTSVWFLFSSTVWGQFLRSPRYQNKILVIDVQRKSRPLAWSQIRRTSRSRLSRLRGTRVRSDWVFNEDMAIGMAAILSTIWIQYTAGLLESR